jgi:DNA polymerase-3 subunit gamma/tau
MCSDDFLFSALDICNQCELTFKTSRNQRLHVELTLIRLSGIMHEKKNLAGDREALILPEISKQGGRKKTDPAPVIPEKQKIEKTSLIRESEHDYNSVSKISIKDALKAAESKPDGDDTQTTENEGDGKPGTSVNLNLKPLSEDYLVVCWNAFADQIREERPRMGVTLKSVRPKITENFTLVIELNNRSQLEDFNRTTRSELEQFLRREMQNNGIHIEANLIESTESDQVKLYTNEEKFRYLSQKNPSLATFRQKLNLELE